ncbi:MAG: outer membrane protein assembly factor BamD [Thermoanaerobaculia bacterium]|nr:outer membrane protein assembly factor BamD [Thermoanaerobaculia bacterium]
MSRVRRAASLVLLSVLVACGGYREDPMLQYSSAEALEQGKLLMAEGKYGQARPFFIHAFEIEPNSKTGREGLLLAADALFLDGGHENFIKAESRYRDFVNRFPTSEHAAYAQFQIGLSLSRRVVKPDRDQSTTEEALAALRDVQRFYPGSSYAEQAGEEIAFLSSRQAEHDYVVGRFYQRFGIPASAIRRYDYILETYPEYPETDKVLFRLCESYYTNKKNKDDLARASTYCRRLTEEYPESQWVKRIPKKLPLDLEAPVEDEEDEGGDRTADAADSGV